jgi:opacity protein-like surface antigen
MKKFNFFAVLTGVMSSLPFVADAAYPVYNPQQLARQGYVINNYSNQPVQYKAAQYNPQQMAGRTNITTQQMVAASAANGRPMVSNISATNPNRVTGALPRVGSAATNAGRQYYQSSDYDRLADSGLYVGLSAGYSTMISGQMSADYSNENNAFFAPGSFRPSDFNHDSVIPLQVSVGAAINSDIRVDFSYLRYTGMSYASNVQTSTGDGFVEASVSGGAITSNSTMLNVYYNIDSFTGYVAGGSMRPYVGGGIGLALNTIADYVVYDSSFYDETGGVGPGNIEAGGLTGISDIYAYHNGGTMEQLAYQLEAGVTTAMNDGLKLDFFVRYAKLGKVKTSGSVIVSQTEWLSDGSGYDDGEYEAPYDSVFHYTNWCESGDLSSLDVGVRLRLEF